MSNRPISCQERDELFATVGMRSAQVSSSLTNFVGGTVLDDRLPPHTATTWATPEGDDFLREVIDADGCRHWAIIAAADKEPTP